MTTPHTEAFRRELAEGQHWERVVIDYLRGQGIDVTAPEQIITPDRESGAAMRNSADCYLYGGRYRVEIKSRRLRFTSPADLPYDPFFVDTVAKWELRTPQPIGMILVSRETGAMIAVSKRTRPAWVVLTRDDRSRGIVGEKFLAAPRACWVPVEELVAGVRRVMEADARGGGV